MITATTILCDKDTDPEMVIRIMRPIRLPWQPPSLLFMSNLSLSFQSFSSFFLSFFLSPFLYSTAAVEMSRKKNRVEDYWRPKQMKDELKVRETDEEAVRGHSRQDRVDCQGRGFAKQRVRKGA